MDIYQARRTNLLRLIDDDFGGSQTAFAAAVGLKPPQVNRWVSETASEKRRITEGSARHIEERCHKEAGFFLLKKLTARLLTGDNRAVNNSFVNTQNGRTKR